jgi:hypothetical protein
MLQCTFLIYATILCCINLSLCELLSSVLADYPYIHCCPVIQRTVSILATTMSCVIPTIAPSCSRLASALSCITMYYLLKKLLLLVTKGSLYITVSVLRCNELPHVDADFQYVNVPNVASNYQCIYCTFVHVVIVLVYPYIPYCLDVADKVLIYRLLRCYNVKSKYN